MAHLVDIIFVLGLVGSVYLGIKVSNICREKEDKKLEEN